MWKRLFCKFNKEFIKFEYGFQKLLKKCEFLFESFKFLINEF